VQLGVRGIPLGIAVMLVGFVLKSAGTRQGRQTQDCPLRAFLSSWTIHPEVFRLGAPLGSESAGERVRLASLEPQVGLFDAPTSQWGMLTDTGRVRLPRRAVRRPFHHHRGGRSSASFDKRFASSEDCPASFDESLASAMGVLASSLRLPPDQGIQKKRADAPRSRPSSKQTLALARPRKEVAPIEDDGRVAIYDISARTVYLPSGRGWRPTPVSAASWTISAAWCT